MAARGPMGLAPEGGCSIVNNLLRRAPLKILKPNKYLTGPPELILIDLHRIEIARARAMFAVEPRAIDVERAIVAKALEDVLGRNELDGATGTRTRRAEALNSARGGFPQVNVADQALGVRVSEVLARGDHLE